MSESMVTGRVDAQKKAKVANILSRNGLNASCAINLMYDRIEKDGNVDFLTEVPCSTDKTAWQNAVEFVDSLSSERSSRFDDMSKAEIRSERLKKRGLM